MDERGHNRPDAGDNPARPPEPPTGNGGVTTDPPGRGALAAAYVIIAGLAIGTAGIVLAVIGWGVIQFILANDTGFNWTLWPVMTGLSAGITIVAAIPILFMRRYVRLHRIGIAWLVAAVIAGLVGLCRLVPLPDGLLGLAVQAIAWLLLAAGLWVAWRVARRGTARPVGRPAAPAAFFWALCAGGIAAIPWAAFGAFGGVWETVLAAVVAIGFGVVTAFVLGDRFWAPWTRARPARRVFGGGGAAGLTLLVLGSALGGGGIGLLAMISLPALGFVIAVLQRRTGRTGRIVAAAVTPAAFGPLAFVDSDEFLPLTFGPEFARWPATALAIAVLLAWVVAAVASGTARRIIGYPAVAAGAVVIVLAAGAAIHQWTQPGFTGEKLLVVLDRQPDLSTVTGDLDERRARTYQQLVDNATESQRGLRADLDEAGIEYRPFYLVNAVEVDDAPFRRAWLENRADVAAVLLAPQSRPVPEPESPMSGGGLTGTDPQPNITQVDAPAAWETGADGSGITIGISDSGVDGEHPAVADRFRGGDDSWIDPINGSTTPVDPNGHGTHALGLALGGNGIGVAPKADWMGCANLPRNAGNPADYLACLQFMLAPYPSGGDPFTDGDPSRAADVTTNSWGCPEVEGCDRSILRGATSAFHAAGIFFAVAAGNSGPDCGTAATPPAGDPDTFAVGAVNSDNVIADFSSRGPVDVDGHRVGKPQLSAPGVEVLSALPGGGYGRLSGTSMAAPQVAGAVAVLWSGVPELRGDVDATARLLTGTARDVDAKNLSASSDCGLQNTVGAGVVDVAAALDAAKQAAE